MNPFLRLSSSQLRALPAPAATESRGVQMMELFLPSVVSGGPLVDGAVACLLPFRRIGSGIPDIPVGCRSGPHCWGSPALHRCQPH